MPYQYKREPLTKDEAGKLANACETGLERLIIWTLLDSGLRVSELSGLKSNNIDWQGHELVIHGKGGPFGSQSKRRVVPMSDRVKTLLENHMAIRTSKEGFGKSRRQIERIVKRVANRAKISKPVCPHVLRHTYACKCVRDGISTAALKKLLGHDRLETTEIYLNMSGAEAGREFREKWT